MKKAIYKITNITNNKCYIGQSSDPQRRWKKHLYLSKSKGKKSLIQEKIKEIGKENFIFEILGWFEDYNEKEKYYIKYYNSYYPNGYNLTYGGEEPPILTGEKNPNSKYSEELCNKIILDLQSKKYTLKQIQEKYDVNEQLVSSINRGATHRRKGISYPIVSNSLYHLSEDEFWDIVYLLKYSTCTCNEIGAYFGKTGNAIKAINSGKNHYNEKIKYPIRNFRGKANSQSVETILAKRSTKTIDTFLEM